jgi:hypothetical protein
LHDRIREPCFKNLGKAYIIVAESRMPRLPATEYTISTHRSDDPRKKLMAAENIPSSIPTIKCPRITTPLFCLSVKYLKGTLFRKM